MPRSLLTLYLEGIYRKHWAVQEQSLLHQEVFLINTDLAKLLIRNTLTNSAGPMLAASSMQRQKGPRGRGVAAWSWQQSPSGAVDGEDFTGHRDWFLLRGVYLEMIAGLGAIFHALSRCCRRLRRQLSEATLRVLLSAEQLEAFQTSGTPFSTNCVTHFPCPLQHLERVKTPYCKHPKHRTEPEAASKRTTLISCTIIPRYNWPEARFLPRLPPA